MLELTLAELARFDGRAGAPAYIAFQGKVYDVSRSFLWQQGRHQVLHAAGKDLTGEIEAAPHTAAMLERVPIVGTLADGR
jgi:predicted heme/steroid binding protein